MTTSTNLQVHPKAKIHGGWAKPSSRATICIKKTLLSLINVWRVFIYHRVSKPSLLSAPRSSELSTGLLHYPTSRPNLPNRRLCPSFRIRVRCVRPAIARSFSLESDGVSREGLMIGSRCIKRFIFTRTAGSRVSWHNASGNSRAFRTPSRYSETAVIPIGAGTSPSVPRSEYLGSRASCISSVNVHIASTLATIFRPVGLAPPLRS